MRLIGTYIGLILIAITSVNGKDIYNFFDGKNQVRRFRDIKKEEAHVVTQYKNGVTWKLWYIMIGTRSEGIHGEIFDKNRKVLGGDKLGEERHIQGVDFVWRGLLKDRKNLYDQSGWLPKNLNKYSNSRKLMEQISK